MERIEAQSNTYTAEHIESQRSSERDDYRSKLAELLPDIENRLNEIEPLLVQLHGEPDLSNAELARGIDLILKGVEC